VTAAGTPEDRDVVPRWRPFGATVRSGETMPLRLRDASAAAFDLSEPEAAFREAPGLHTASDLVGSALSAGARTEPSLEAARYLLAAPAARPDPKDLARALLAQGVCGPQPRDDVEAPRLDFMAVRARARELRRIVRNEPRNAVRWADLALAHTVLGHPQQAEREITTALTIAGPNRFLLRAAARLYVHLDRPDAAHDLLTRDPAVLDDPWLAAAELATASLAGRSSQHARRARLLLDDVHGHAPRHLAELAGQVATAELRAGRHRHAKRLMATALREPTDNVLAQAEWASANGLNLDRADLDRPRTYEAQALRHSHEGNWPAASAAGMEWLADQPFAHEPAQFTSYAASVGAQDWALAETAARAGLVANPDDHLLRNNLAFALASQDRAAEAYDQLRLIAPAPLDARERAVVMATQGLVLFRAGHPERGRQSYETAVAALAAGQNLDLAALASAFWAREEVLARTDHAAQVTAAAAERVRSTGFPAAMLWQERVESLIVSGAAAQGPVGAQRVPPTDW
jgi:hypothetical protein